MPDDTAGKYLFDRPGLYQIRVVGELYKCWIDHLEGLEISTTSWGRHRLVTQISGWLADQTALSGLLDLLTELSMVILSVERIEADDDIEQSRD